MSANRIKTGAAGIIWPLLMVIAAASGLNFSRTCWGAETINPARPGSGRPRVLYYGLLNTINRVNLNDARVAIEWNFIRNYPEWHGNFEIKLKILDHAASAAALIRKRELHALSVTSIDYLVLRQLAPVKVIGISSKKSDTPLETYVLLAARDLDWNKLAVLDKRRLMVEKKTHWDIGRMWLDNVLLDHELPECERFFTSIQAADKPTRQILPVFFGQAEACLVSESAFDTMVELNPQIRGKLHALARSPGLVENLICVTDNLNRDFSDFADELQDSILDMHQNPDTQQVLLISQIKRNFPFNADYMVDTQRVYQKYVTRVGNE